MNLESAKVFQGYEEYKMEHISSQVLFLLLGNVFLAVRWLLMTWGSGINDIMASVWLRPRTNNVRKPFSSIANSET